MLASRPRRHRHSPTHIAEPAGRNRDVVLCQKLPQTGILLPQSPALCIGNLERNGCAPSFILGTHFFGPRARTVSIYDRTLSKTASIAVGSLHSLANAANLFLQSGGGRSKTEGSTCVPLHWKVTCTASCIRCPASSPDSTRSARSTRSFTLLLALLLGSV